MGKFRALGKDREGKNREIQGIRKGQGGSNWRSIENPPWQKAHLIMVLQNMQDTCMSKFEGMVCFRQIINMGNILH